MSRVSVLESLYSKKKSALEFNYDNLWAPPIRALIPQEDINELIRIATSLKYNGNIDLKYKLIDKVMNKRGFRKAHAGTNRVVYNFLEDPRFVAKIAIDRVGMKDTPSEFKNQKFFAPFCCKIFEVDESGVIGFVERVNPITSLEEFLSVSDDIFNMIITKIVGKYVVDDIGTTKFMNFGLRMNGFGPVIIDFPYAYELDGRKLRCNKMNKTPFGQVPCGGEIDYDAGFNYLVCTKCGRIYQARDLANETKDILILNSEGREDIMSRVRIIDPKSRKVIIDDCTSTRNYISKEKYEAYLSHSGEFTPVEKVGGTRTNKRKSKEEMRNSYYTNLVLESFSKTAPLSVPLSEALGKTSRVKVGGTITNGKKDIPVVTGTDDSKDDGIKRVQVKSTQDKMQEVHDTLEEKVTKLGDRVVEAGETLKQNLTTAIDKVINTDNSHESSDAVENIPEAPETDTADNTNEESDEINKAIDTVVKYTVGGEDSDEASEENNIDLSDFSIGRDAEVKEPDYSNYEAEESPEESEEHSDDYEADHSEYVKKIRKEKHKQHKFSKDMEEY